MPAQGGAFQLGGMAVKMLDITDGASSTILAGEKHVPMYNFGVGVLDSSTYNGDYPYCFTRAAGMGLGIAQSNTEWSWKWGSYHPHVCLFVFCDGSVQILKKAIPPDSLGALCTRSGDEPTPEW
jgi:hypothetical protein